MSLRWILKHFAVLRRMAWLSASQHNIRIPQNLTMTPCWRFESGWPRRNWEAGHSGSWDGPNKFLQDRVIPSSAFVFMSNDVTELATGLSFQPLVSLLLTENTKKRRELELGMFFQAAGLCLHEHRQNPTVSAVSVKVVWCLKVSHLHCVSFTESSAPDWMRQAACHEFFTAAS